MKSRSVIHLKEIYFAVTFTPDLSCTAHFILMTQAQLVLAIQAVTSLWKKEVVLALATCCLFIVRPVTRRQILKGGCSP